MFIVNFNQAIEPCFGLFETVLILRYMKNIWQQFIAPEDKYTIQEGQSI